MTTNLAHTNPALSDFDTQARRELGERFQIEVLLCRGPNSLVYRTGQAFAGKPVLVKVISKGGLAERFASAAAVASQMEHPHVVPVLEAGETNQFLWYTMPQVQGESLDSVIAREGPLDLKRCLRMTEQIASALQYGHRRGVVHGNLKPENVIVGPDGWTLVSDFGLPGAAERTGDIGMSDRLRAYVAPELLESTQAVPASDQYALAVLIHECLVGAVPANPGTPDEPLPANPKIARPRSRTGRPTRPLPERTVPALRRAMAQTPQERFPTVLGFVAILDSGPAPSVSASFARAPNKKPEPRVLTMEPETNRGRILLWMALLALGVGAVFAARRMVAPRQFQAIADRFDRWYEADAPPGGIMVPPSRPAEPTRSPASTPTPPADSPRAADLATRQTAPQPERQKPAAVVPRAVAPRPSPPVVVPRAPAPVPPPTEPEPAEPGRLFVSSTPWGTVYVDGRAVGNTPLLNLQVAPGTHSIRIVHDGFEPYERTIDVASGEPLRLTGIALQEKP